MERIQICYICDKFRILDSQNIWSKWQSIKRLKVKVSFTEKIICEDCVKKKTWYKKMIEFLKKY